MMRDDRYNQDCVHRDTRLLVLQEPPPKGVKQGQLDELPRPGLEPPTHMERLPGPSTHKGVTGTGAVGQWKGSVDVEEGEAVPSRPQGLWGSCILCVDVRFIRRSGLEPQWPLGSSCPLPPPPL